MSKNYETTNANNSAHALGVTAAVSKPEHVSVLARARSHEYDPKCAALGIYNGPGKKNAGQTFGNC